MAEWDRRTVLTLGAAAVAGLPLLSACTTSGSSAPDPLLALADAASRDAANADAVYHAFPSLSAARAVGRARAEQAAALRKEVDRAAAATKPSGPPPFAPPKPSADKASAAASITASLRRAQDNASALVGTVPAYRAGLVGSVAAGCAALKELFA